ncbi:uncharacterized protein EHS24_005905 [Apiotrichum porosum]|uniref:Uncharacterized protein n=1 Tax=Apiotrichum porosum TaxID=105984 RepID=A0A427Y065_9TREE|nr:uncharacterized protein EHS24_005905 [Apiotrichum porosum]RSH84385.1 hypothetical protein EHS24_005905 [Apiotrichum porosum]
MCAGFGVHIDNDLDVNRTERGGQEWRTNWESDLVSTSEVSHLALKYENAEEVGTSGTLFI